MKILLSPSKTQNFEPLDLNNGFTKPTFAQEIQQLVHKLKDSSQADLIKLMSISSNLAELNYSRFQKFQPDFTQENSKPAIFAFKGDVYTDIKATKYSKTQLDFANSTIRILSGLYGILRPLDLIQPYRLEMKTKLKTENNKDLYEFWNTKITDFLNQEESALIVNLASEEYFKVLQPKNLKANLLNISFKENREGKLKIIAIYAKKARGTMANFLVENKIETIDGIKKFNLDNYKFSETESQPNQLVFTR
jgi:hypothetical protein